MEVTVDLRWPDNSVSRLAFPAEFQIHGVDPLPLGVSAAHNAAASQSQALNNWATRPTLFRHRNQRRQEKNQIPAEPSQKQPIIPSETEHPPAHVNTEEQVIPQVALAESSGAFQQEAAIESDQQHYELDPQPMIIASGSTQGVPRQIQDQEISPPAKRQKPFIVLEVALAEEEAELAAEAGG
ncbi:hypothetical protein R1sor_000096 [Riccia sorocarpa]|uniref:Uncharacterized protein n=1 Tax=Riccia sorocarpa TaxID=122646 RepID=A0ABD3GW50_9MARC